MLGRVEWVRRLNPELLNNTGLLLGLTGELVRLIEALFGNQQLLPMFIGELLRYKQSQFTCN